MAEHTGRYGEIDGIPAVRSWNLTEGYTLNTQVASNTKHGTNRTRGVYDWTGSFTAYGHTPTHMPGDVVAAQLYKSPDATGDVDNGDVAAGDIYIERVAITWDFATNQVISYTCDFGGDGDLTWQTDSQPNDTSAFDEDTPCAGKWALWDGVSTETIIAHIAQAVLTIERPAVTAVNSGTTAGAGKCTTNRHPGAAVDWNLALSMEEGNIISALNPGSVVWLRGYVDATAYWDLKWGICGERSGITVDRETGAVISFSQTISMKGSNAGVIGLINKPGAVSWWPA